MSKDYNNIGVLGRLTRDPEIRYLRSGTPIVNFSIANNQDYNDSNGQKVNKCYFFDVTVYGNQALNCEKYLKKGSQVIVQGMLKQETWQDKTTGQNRSKVVIQSLMVQFIGSPNSQQQGNNNYQQPPPQGNYQQPNQYPPQQQPPQNQTNPFTNYPNNQQNQNQQGFYNPPPNNNRPLQNPQTGVVADPWADPPNTTNYNNSNNDDDIPF